MSEESPKPAFEPEEKEILRWATAMKDLLGTEGWKTFEEIVKRQIDTRQMLLVTPLSASVPAFAGMDFTTRAAHLETIKGAIIGLRLALDTPPAIIKQATDIRSEATE